MNFSCFSKDDSKLTSPFEWHKVIDDQFTLEAKTGQLSDIVFSFTDLDVSAHAWQSGT